MKLLDIKIDAISTSDVLKQFQKYLDDGQKHHIVTTNPEFIVEAKQNPRFAEIINNSDLSVIDGMGVLIGLYYVTHYKSGNTSKFNGFVNLFKSYLFIQKAKQPVVMGDSVLQRTTGTDLVWLITQQDWMKFRKIYLLGGTNNVAARAAKRLSTVNPEVQFRFSNGHQNIRSANGAEENHRIIEDINQFKPDLLLVAYGHPWQDLWIDSVRDQISFKVAIGVGGAFDYIAKEVPRAPLWVRNLGLEWFYRLLKNPSRYQRILSATWKFCSLLITYK